MSSEFLDAYIENASYNINEYHSLLENHSINWKGILSYCKSYRQRGLCTLFLHGDENEYFLNVMQSSSAMLNYLKNCINNDDRFCISQNEALFDSIGGGYWDCAKEIASFSPDNYNADYEYEEDFLYRKLLIGIGITGEKDSYLNELLVHYDKMARKYEPVRVEICRSLFEKNSENFHNNLCQLLEEQSEEIEKKINREVISDEEGSWLRYFNNEGLSLIRIALKRDIKIEKDYLHIPEELIYKKSLPFNKDAWKNK